MTTKTHLHGMWSINFQSLIKFTVAIILKLTKKNLINLKSTSNYRIIKSSFGHPFLIRPKYSDGRSGERNDNDNGYLCFKTSNKIGRGDQMYISGSGFVTIKSKKTIDRKLS